MSRHKFYTLNDSREPLPCSHFQWATEFERERIRVGDDMIGDVRVSTVFLGMDHSFLDTGPPLLFETLVMGGPHDGDMERCSTWAEAELQHVRMVDRVIGLQTAS